ncbi:MAG: prepilin-type N-terminal cleavage/methylation domain-containing protein [Acidobacteria bacterium]|nr:prepilin-type N-terminal cleavage/methylation domain-containing protein [Acidobacteriota bacterium]
MRESLIGAKTRGEAGFSLLELLIAMTVTLMMMTAATTLLTSSVGTRARENRRSDALADAQRALNIMSREIANSGFGLSNNGIVATDVNFNKIRIRANINNTNDTTNDQDEDITFIYQPPPVASIVRFDRVTNSTTVLANNITSFTLTYRNAAGNTVDATGNPLTPGLTERITIDVTVDVGAPAGQPPMQVRMMSDVALRNAPLVLKRY